MPTAAPRRRAAQRAHRPARSGGSGGGPSDRVSSLGRLVEDCADSLEQLPHADGLALKAVEAGRHDLLAVLGHDRRGNSDDRDATGVGVRSKLVERYYPANPWQLD